MKAEEILATYCTGSMFILERQDVVVGILQDNGVKKKRMPRRRIPYSSRTIRSDIRAMTSLPWIPTCSSVRG